MQGRPKRAASIAAAITVAMLGALPATASADLLAPDSPASGSAGTMRTIYVIMAVLAVLVVLAVIATVLRAVGRSRAAAEEPAPRRRSTPALQERVVLGLTGVALVLFVVGIVFTESARDVEASKTGADPITIQVDGQQWLWRYEYPVETPSPDGFSADAAYGYNELVIPVDTPITLEISSVDVTHRWAVPALARAADAVPGIVNEVHFTATEEGTYEGRSTEFSGPGYATMRTTVRVVPQDEYEAFLQQRVSDIKAARAAVQEQVESGAAPGVKFEEQN